MTSLLLKDSECTGVFSHHCLLLITLVLFFFVLSGPFPTKSDVCSAKSDSSKCFCSQRVCTQHAEQANCPCSVFPCVFTIVAASRSIEDVDKLFYGSLVSHVAEFLFEASRHSICTHDYIMYMFKPITSKNHVVPQCDCK